MTQPNIDPWEVTGFTTDRIRDAANTLRDAISKIELPDGGRSENDTALMRAVEALAISADHIDRMDQRTRPCIVQISTCSNDETLELFGLDNMGQLWQYKFNQPRGDDSPLGWLSMRGNITQWPDSPVPTRSVQ